MSTQTSLETALLAGRPHRDMGSRHRLWAAYTQCVGAKPDVATGQAAVTLEPEKSGSVFVDTY